MAFGSPDPGEVASVATWEVDQFVFFKFQSGVHSCQKEEEEEKEATILGNGEFQCRNTGVHARTVFP